VLKIIKKDSNNNSLERPAPVRKRGIGKEKSLGVPKGRKSRTKKSLHKKKSMALKKEESEDFVNFSVTSKGRSDVSGTSQLLRNL